MELSLFEIMQRNSIDKRDKEYLKRKYSSSTLEFDLVHNNSKLFLALTSSMIKSLNKIIEYKHNKIYSTFYKTNKETTLYNNYLFKLLEEELIATNDIEGIKMTTNQFNDAIKANKENVINKSVNFQFLINGYYQLSTGNYPQINNVQDVRLIYDNLLKNEIAFANNIDGILFRKEGVNVTTNTGKIIHRGILPETKIISSLSKVLDLINVENSLYEPIINIALFHYYFNYIHPFYDSNGRLSRYLTSLFIIKEYDLFLGLKLSKIISKHQKLYYKAFINTNHKDNKSDMTHFVSFFLDIIVEAIEEIHDELYNYINK